MFIATTNLRVLAIGVSASLASLFLTHWSEGKDPKFKRELFRRGVEQLQLLKQKSPADYENALASAYAIDPDQLPKELIAKLKLSESAAFQASVNGSPFLRDSKMLLRIIPQENFSKTDAEFIAKLSYLMGTRKEDLAELLESCESILVSGNFTNDFLLDKGRAAADKDGDRLRRIEYLRFHYSLGRLQDDSTLETSEFFLRGISNPKLKKFIQAVWLTKVGTKVLTGTELLQEVNKIQPSKFAFRVLFESLQRYDETQIKSMVGDVLITQLIQLYFETHGQAEECDSYLNELRDCFTEPFAVQNLFRRISPTQIVELAKRTQAFQTERDIVEQILLISVKKKLEPELLQNWWQALMNSCLAAGNLDGAKAIAQRFSLSLPPKAIFNMAIEQNRIAMAKQIVDSGKSAGPREKNLLASRLLEEGRNKEAGKYIDQLKIDFERQLEKQPERKRASWLVNFVLLNGWSMRNIDIPKLPLEQAVLESFKPLASTTGINDTIARSLDSFTPPTPASRRLLLKMMQLLPESEQIVSSFEVNQLARKIRVAPKTDLVKLRKEAIQLFNRAVSRRNSGNKSDYASRLSYAFAFAGDKEGVTQLIEEIPTPEYKSWALFQCAKVFPPRVDAIQKYDYSRRSFRGGVF